MFLYFDKNGVLKEIINDKALRKASSGTIYAFFDGDVVFNDLYFYIKKSNDETLTHTQAEIQRESREIPYSRDRKLNYFEYFKKYNFYKYDLQNEDLNVAGLWELTIQGYDLNSMPYAFGSFIGLVEDNAIKVDTNITQAEYEELKKLLSLKATWSEIEQYIGLSREYIHPLNYTDYLQKYIFNLKISGYVDEPTRLYKVSFNNEEFIVKNYDDILKDLTIKYDGEIANLKNQYNALIGFNFIVVDELPKQGTKGTLYWLNVGNNKYDVYLWDGTKFELIFNDLDFRPTDYTTKDEFEELVKETATDVDYIDKKFTLLHDTTEISGQIDKIGVDTFNRQDIVSKENIDREYQSKGGTLQNVSKKIFSRQVRQFAYENDYVELTEATGVIPKAICDRLTSDINNYIVYKNNILKLDVINKEYHIYTYENLNYVLTLDTETCEYSVKSTQIDLVPFVQKYKITTQGDKIGGTLYFNFNIPSIKASLDKNNLKIILTDLGLVPAYGKVNNKIVAYCQNTQNGITTINNLEITFVDGTSVEYDYENINI